ncbi:MAG: hypothetical protein GKR86_00130 [Ilumatobacter sp.]|nr:hypothetical protein [Ilumatobacter sp.]
MKMPNELEPTNPFGGAVDLVDADALGKALEETQDEGGRLGDVSFMSFSGKRGIYSIGIEKRTPNEGEKWLINIAGFELGWMCWKGGQPQAKRMANVTAPRIPEPDMTEFGPFDQNKGEGWSRARAVSCRSFENGEQVYFSNNSKSGVAGMSDLQKAVTGRLKSGQPAWPVVTFGIEEFESQGFKNFKPVFEVVQWLDMDDVKKLSEEGTDPQAVLDEAGSGQDEGPAPEPQPRRRL